MIKIKFPILKKFQNGREICFGDQNTSEQLIEAGFMYNIFGNNGNAVTPQEIESINYSLMMLKVSSFELVPNNKQFRLRFQFKNNNYDLPITDPKFLHACRHDQGILDNINTIYFLIIKLSFK